MPVLLRQILVLGALAGPAALAQGPVTLPGPGGTNQIEASARRAASLLPQPVALVEDFLVHDDSSGWELAAGATIGIDGRGYSSIMWTRNPSGIGPAGNVYLQRYDEMGTPLGRNIVANDLPFSVLSASMKVEEGGGIIVAWSGERDSSLGILLQRYDPDGRPEGGNVRVSDDAAGEVPGGVLIGVNGRREAVVGWSRSGETVEFTFQIFGPEMARLGMNVRAITSLSAPSSLAAVAITDSREVATAWLSRIDGKTDVYVQSFDLTGAPLADAVRLNDDSLRSVWSNPAVGFDDAGGIVLVWDERSEQVAGNQVTTQRLLPDGSARSPKVTLAPEAQGSYSRPSLAMGPAGDFAVGLTYSTWGAIAARRQITGAAMVARFDGDGRVMWLNPAASVWAGYYPQEKAVKVAVSRTGEVAAVWQQGSGPVGQLFMRHFDPDGATEASERRARVDGATIAWPSVSMTRSGAYAVGWEAPGSASRRVYFCTYDSLWKLSIPPTSVGEGVHPAVGLAEDGRLGVLWQKHVRVLYGSGGSYRYDPAVLIVRPDGGVLGDNQQLKYFDVYGTLFSHIQSDVDGRWSVMMALDTWVFIPGLMAMFARLDDGGRVIVPITYLPGGDQEEAAGSSGRDESIRAWREAPPLGATGGGDDVFVQRFDLGGTATGGKVRVNDVGRSVRSGHPVVARDRQGGFVVAWSDARTGDEDVYFQGFGPDGQKLGPNVHVSMGSTVAAQRNPQIAMRSDGSFVIVWEDSGIAASAPDIVGQRFRPDGSPWGAPHRIVEDGPWHLERSPALSGNDSGLVIAWVDNRRGAGCDLYAKIVGWDWPGETKEPVSLALNGGFEFGENPWEFYTNGSGSFNTQGKDDGGSKAGRVVITGVGSNVQLYQSGLRLEPARRYRLRFQAYSTSGNDIAVLLHKDDAPYTNYGLWWGFDLGTEWETHEHVFVTEGFANPVADGRLRFWLAPYARAGDEYLFDDIELEYLGAAGGGNETVAGIGGEDPPRAFSLLQNYPNPFNPTTTIVFALPQASEVRLSVFDILGRESVLLVNERREAGFHQAHWDASGWPSGVYFYRLRAGNFVETRRLVLVR